MMIVKKNHMKRKMHWNEYIYTDSWPLLLLYLIIAYFVVMVYAIIA